MATSKVRRNGPYRVDGEGVPEEDPCADNQEGHSPDLREICDEEGDHNTAVWRQPGIRRSSDSCRKQMWNFAIFWNIKKKKSERAPTSSTDMQIDSTEQPTTIDGANDSTNDDDQKKKRKDPSTQQLRNDKKQCTSTGRTQTVNTEASGV